jgi:hypothetical protein
MRILIKISPFSVEVKLFHNNFPYFPSDGRTAKTKKCFYHMNAKFSYHKKHSMFDATHFHLIYSRFDQKVVYDSALHIISDFYDSWRIFMLLFLFRTICMQKSEL